MDSAPTIAIVGRPNVGKSTLFNRLINDKKAIISDQAGTTRDRISQKFTCNDYETILVDTGGLEYGKKENIEADVQSQAHVAIEDATLILFVVDMTQELTVDDFTAANILRKSRKPVILIGNKCDNVEIENNVYNIYELGFDTPVKISSIHKLGIEELKHQIEKNLKELKVKKPGKNKKKQSITNICILGKPNAGKSSLVNSLFGTEKVIVSDIPGTTRDSIDTEITFNEKKYNLIDTAGLRRRGKIERGIEKFSSLRCITSIERSDVVVLLIDGNKGITSQDCHIAEFALNAEKGLILAINKVDLFEKGEELRNLLITKLRRRFAFVPWAPILFVSAKNHLNVDKIFDLTEEIIQERVKRIPTPELNNFFKKITFKHLPASANIRKPKYLYATQADINPPRFVLFFKNSKNLHFSYPRYLENEIRKEYGFTGTPIALKFRENLEEPKSAHR